MKLRNIEETDDDAIEAVIKGNIFLRVLEFGLKQPDGFTHKEIVEGLNLQGWEKTTVERYLHAASQNAYSWIKAATSSGIETPFFVIEGLDAKHFRDEACKYIISFDSHFKYLDYQELKLARKNAKEAKSLALIAIGVSAIAVVVSALVPILVAIYMTQTIKVDQEQLAQIESVITVQTAATAPPQCN